MNATPDVWPPAPMVRGLRMAVVDHPLAFHKPAQTSRDTLTHKPTWFLVAEDEQGRIGVGECSLIPGLSLESEAQAHQGLFKVASSGCLDAMSVPANLPSVRFAVETAAWDLHAGGRGVIAASAFSRGERAIDINGLVWMGDVDGMLRQFDDLVDRGFSTLKCKVGAHDWDTELGMLQQVRERYPSPDFTLRVDANGAFSSLSLDETRARLEALARLKIHSIEQPLKPHDRDGLAELCEENILPIALDESLIGVHVLKDRMQLLDQVRPQFLVLKPSLIGGLDAATVWSRLAEQRGVGWWATSALESNVGLNAIAQWTAVQPALSPDGARLPQGLGTGGLFINNLPSPLAVTNGTLTTASQAPRDETLWRNALRGVVRHEPGCGCGVNHGTA
jgi:o-succinylbenzoate synthase